MRRTWLGDALQKSGCALDAYVLMTNHVHLLFTPPSAEAVSQRVISLGRRYVQYINKTYRRTGTLWDSRYKSSLVHADAYLGTSKNHPFIPFDWAQESLRQAQHERICDCFIWYAVRAEL